MTTRNMLDELEHIQKKIRTLGAQLEDHDYRQQYHTDLSPLGWHVGHCTFIETYWLREVVLGDSAATGDLQKLYVPENIPKPQRGPALPAHHEHLAWCEQLNHENRALLANPPALLAQHSLSTNDYLGKFIVQHHAQHLETMHMVLQQRALQYGASNYSVDKILQAAISPVQTVTLSAGNYRIGSEHAVEAFDNEVPPHTVELAEVHIAQRPVDNAAWLAFIEAGGYETRAWWDKDGWAWRIEADCHCPQHWRQDNKGNWFGLERSGPRDLVANEPVYGINYFEANAFVTWLNAEHNVSMRLLHEYEWEAAANEGLLSDTGRVWEWCANSFHPYEGFSPFPYDNYSKPWFDNRHYVLRGASENTCDVIRRNSFRNFYNPDKRHIFAGTRLALE